MSMPIGSVEEPQEVYGMQLPWPVHVASSDAEPTKAVGTEFGRWRTMLLTTAQGSQDTATPGGKRLVNRSQRRHRFLIKVSGSGNISVNNPSPAQPAIPASTVAIQNPNVYPVTVVITGGTMTAVVVNGITVGAGAGTYIVPAAGSISMTYTVAPTWVWSNANGLTSSVPQTVTDGVIIGSKEEITSGGGPIGTPMTPGTVGGYLQIGDSARVECQAEMWVAPVASNSAGVYVTICDEQYAAEVAK